MPIAPARWTLMRVAPWHGVDGQVSPSTSAAGASMASDVLYRVSPGEQVALPLGAIGAFWCRLDIPAEQPPGIYHGSLWVQPMGEAAQAVPITVTVWAVPLPATFSMSVAAGIDNTVTAKTSAKALQALDGEYHLALLADYPAPARPGWYQVLEPGPLSQFASLVAVRLLPWAAWAQNKTGILIPMLYRWAWAGTPTPPGASLPSCPGAVGDLVYPPADSQDALLPSVRLEVLREGLADVACLQQLADARQHNTLPPADLSLAGKVLEQARQLSTTATAPETIDRLRELRRIIAGLLSDCTVAKVAQ